jgi:hypothetical protein
MAAWLKFVGEMILIIPPRARAMPQLVLLQPKSFSRLGAVALISQQCLSKIEYLSVTSVVVEAVGGDRR